MNDAPARIGVTAPRNATAPKDATARGSWKLRDRPGLFWLFTAAVVALIHPLVPEARWLMVHMVVLGVVTHSILVWSAHFTRTLLKASDGPNDRRLQSTRLLLLHGGTVALMVSVPFRLWPVTLIGGTVIAAAVVWHGLSLWRLLRRALPARFTVTVRYYLAAAVFLPLGATFGVLLAREPGAMWHGRLLVAHTMANLLGWVGLTATGTLLTLWPTILRTRMADSAVRITRRTLPLIGLAAAAVVTGALVGQRWVAVVGLAGYLVALLILAGPMVTAARAKPPVTFPQLSLAFAYTWMVAGLVVVALTLATEGTWGRIGDSYTPITAILVVGFGLQLVLGALSYLLPVVVGGGPAVLREGRRWMEGLGVLRVGVLNLGLLICLLPVPSLIRVVVSILVLIALAGSLPAMLGGIRAMVRARRAKAAGTLEARGAEPDRFSGAQALAAVLVLVVAASVGIGLDPTAAGLGRSSPAAAVQATGNTTTIRVEAIDMKFVPDVITVPAGDRLVIELINTDPTTVHDLVLATGVTSGRLDPGQSATVDAGVMGASTDGWCSIVGHRQMGMTLTIQVTGHTADAVGSGAVLDLHGVPAPDFGAVDATLPPLTDETVRRVTLEVTDEVIEVAPGVRQLRWTFNGQVPGPTLHGRVGDTFEVTLVNNGTMGHSIDFHASEIAPDQAMRTVPPGESLTYTFIARRAGIWMYHCSTMPMSTHIAAGMHGAVVIEPDGLQPVDRSYVLVQSEVFFGGEGEPVDAAKVRAQSPDAVVFNGIAHQYAHRPLEAQVGERVRFWVLDAGPDRALSFHIVGAQFDTVYAEGAYRLRHGSDAFGQTTGGSQSLGLLPAQGGFVETVFVEPGNYPVVNHSMTDAERGAHGMVRVGG
jgi:nitrite reductase (NO-forming)